MAKIPAIRQIQRTISSGAAPIAQRDLNDPGAGAGFRAGADVMAKLAERKTKDQLAKADMRMSIALTEEINAFNNDPDYKTYSSRFAGNVESRLGEIASTIQDGTARNAFVQAYKPKLAVGLAKINEKARGMWTEDERGQLISDLDAARNAAVESGNILETDSQIMARIDAGVESGYMDADTAAALKIKTRQDLAAGRVQFMAPEDRTKALKQPWAKNLPPDVRAELMRKAEEETRIGKAQATVDKLMGNGLTLAEGMDSIAKIKNPELRKVTEERWAYIKGREDKAELETQSTLADKWFTQVATEGVTVDDIKASGDWDQMSAPLQSTLINAQAASVRTTPIPFNVDAEDRLNYLYKTKQFGPLREFFIASAGNISPEQQKRWSSVSLDGAVPVEKKSLFTAIQSIDAKTPDYTKEQRAPLKNKLDNWYQDYQERENKIPTDDVINKKIDELIMEYPTTGWWMGRDIMPAFEMTPEEQDRAINIMRKDDPETFSRVETYFKISGKQPTPEELMFGYKTLKERGDALH